MGTKIDRQCLGDQIRKELIQRIVSGQLKPGERLIELALAKEFQTSQTPVREALHELQAMRMVEALPHRGVRVREVTEEEMAEAYFVRGMLEEGAAALAVHSSTELTTQLHELAVRIRNAAEQKNMGEYAVHDLTFHRTILVASRNSTLLRLWDSLAFEFRTPLTMARHPQSLAKAASEHFQIVDAFVANDGKLAGHLLRAHAESFIPKQGS